MKIILEAFFDNNFGDDLFIDTVFNRYPNAEFYAFWDTLHPAVLKKAQVMNRLHIRPGNCRIMEEEHFDGYIMVGGDVFMNYGNYRERIIRMEAVKKQGGFVALLGFNLYEEYCDETLESLRTIMSLADVILPRDKATVERLRKIAPEAEVQCTADMAFTATYDTAKTDDREILGIAPRRKYQATDDDHAAYCEAVAAIVDGWLEAHPDGIARFLAFSAGSFDDAAVSREIIALMKHGTKTEIITHNGDISVFLEQLKNCTAMLPTRFHGLVFALIFNIPFVAIAYEVKLNQLLDELNYKGLRLPYGETISSETVMQAVKELDVDQVDGDALAAYCKKAELFFARVDELMAEAKPVCFTEPRPYICNRLADAERAVEELTAKLDWTERQWAYEVQILKWDQVKFEERIIVLEQDKVNITALFNDLNGRTKTLKGLLRLLAKWAVSLIKKDKA
ncbi:MAG: polysaccharide pyruvyl transferase family protein [Oscillospiraceae bacterium]|nr:polysaccharide pyruvyl transferase family protein [Oscillospiraceae bacterium]